MIVFIGTRQYYSRGSSEIQTFSISPGSPGGAVRQADTAQSLAALGDSYFENGRYEDAIKTYRRVFKLAPLDADTHNDLGLALHYTKRSDEALQVLKKATTIDPSLQRGWLSYGFVLQAVGKGKESRSALEKVVALDPASAQGLEANKMLGR